ncbi:MULTISPECIES: CDP-diacylglycerol--glycerol-3-phosphate 3-phosphatidyltransferase [Rheinheimera]|uniref:CDP-diacylglycerol--glycerol-3-phosphate 3-phosphatidyltransferase n=1 Tax=Rheinheimera marina TaxID=1774958 RepID=A0ABV9JIR8_9GAMM
MWNIPNLLTVFRLCLIPICLACFYADIPYARFFAAFCFWLAAITDMLDGYLARKMQLMTPFGAFLDPVADKLMVAAALVLIAVDMQTLWVTIPAFIMISREILISALREWMAEVGQRGQVAVSEVGKYKTAAQMLALIGLIWQPVGWITDLGLVLLYAATLLTVWSMLAYLRAAWPALTK